MPKQISLTHFRTQGDPPADEIIAEFVEKEGVGFIRQLMPFLSDYQNISFNDQPQILKDFLFKNSVFPDFYNKKQIIRATDFYRENIQNIGLILGLYSLPYCYLGADGAKVLHLSERIKNDTSKRLMETGAFLKSVMNYDNWNNRNIFAICLKVRLLHAAIRYFTMKSGRWDMAWGYPINQEDMLGTNLAFSVIVLKGLQKIGHRVDKSFENSFINTWNIIGFLLGVKYELLPENYLRAIKLDQMIAKRQFKQSIEGQELTEALMKSITDLAPNPTIANLFKEQSRFLLGEKYAEMLGIKETNLPKSVLKIYNNTSLLISKIF
jgi:ER-bound oxygenase mpaB/B'/Rubber oxygenase, catalytic domain